MRLIDADAFLEEARNRIDMQDAYLPIHIKELVIDEMPTIEAEPIKIGHWLPYEFGDYHWHKCSVCGKADKYIETIRNGVDLQAIRHFCPICGARMEIEENERKRANETNTTI